MEKRHFVGKKKGEKKRRFSEDEKIFLSTLENLYYLYEKNEKVDFFLINLIFIHN